MPFVKGYKMTKEHKEKIGNANRGKESWSKGKKLDEFLSLAGAYE